MATRNQNRTDAMLGRITAVLESMHQWQQQQSQQPPSQYGVGSSEVKSLTDFRSCNPPKFDGGFKPEEANKWIRTMDKIFRTLDCTEAQKVAYAVYMLEDEAENWWDHTIQLLRYEGRNIDWGVFMEKFLDKYFPEDLRRKKEIEFLQLKQGNMSVGEYAAKFEELMKYSPYYQNNPEERSKCIKFENGLRPELKSVFSYQKIQSFPTLVNMCRMYEDDKKAEVAADQAKDNQQSYGPQRKKSRLNLRNKGPYVDQNRGKERVEVKDGVKSRGIAPYCEKCKRHHFGRNCWATSTCFICGKQGHIARRCRELAKGDLTRPASKPITQGKRLP